MSAPRPVNYYEYIRSDAWKARRLIALARAGHRCQMCAATKSLQVHHNSYANLGNERDEDLCVVCWRCHRQHHSKKRIGVREVEQIVLSRKARQLLRKVDAMPHEVMLTASERRRRQNVAGRWKHKLKQQVKNRKP